jgi:hypothetical protein
MIPGEFGIRHVRGRDEPRLWVPDQVAGAYGDSLTGTGSTRPWNALAHRVIIRPVSIG